MAFAVNIKDGRGPSNEERRQLQLKKTKVMCYKPLLKQQKAYYVLFITGKMEHGPCHQPIDIMHRRGPSSEMQTQRRQR